MNKTVTPKPSVLHLRVICWGHAPVLFDSLSLISYECARKMAQPERNLGSLIDSHASSCFPSLSLSRIRDQEPRMIKPQKEPNYAEQK